MTDLIPAHLAHITAAGFARLTVANRGKILRRADAELAFGLERADTEELTDWLARPGWASQTRASYRDHIRGFFAWACDPRDPILDWDPSAGLARPRLPRTAPRPVTTAELAFALEHAAEPWRTYVLLAAYAGLRACEIATIRREDITEDTITVRGKGGVVACVPTHPAIWRAVQASPRGPIARKLTGGQPDADYVSVLTARYLRQIGLPGVSLHRFRHWLGTHSLRSGGNLRVTQELLRHSSPATTAIYTQITDEERRAVIHALPTPAAC